MREILEEIYMAVLNIVYRPYQTDLSAAEHFIDDRTETDYLLQAVFNVGIHNFIPVLTFCRSF